MTELALIVNAEECIGCSTCEVACKQEHNLPVGPRWIRVSSGAAPQEIGGKLRVRYGVTHCLQCRQPQCRDACPTGAIIKRADGIVLIDEKLCNGCKACIKACPVGAMQFDEKRDKAQKCNMCLERVERGLLPVCVAACPGHCIYFGELSQITRKMGKQELLSRYKDTG